MDERFEELSQRVGRVERRLDAGGASGRVRRRVRALVGTLFPPETRRHWREARRQTWLALRAMVDARIERSPGGADGRASDTEAGPRRG